MKILLLAPQPFFQERGTPIAVRLLAEAYARRGHEVDLVVFREGADIPLPPGIRLHRVASPRGMRPGFSPAKLVGDAAMAFKALRLAWRNRYDVFHGVEEAVFIALALRLIRRARTVHDMDSSMAEQMADKSGFFRRIAPVLRGLENAAMRRADVVAPVCDALADLARPLRDGRPVVLLRDPPVSAPATAEEGAAWRAAQDLRGLQYVYVGNLESYQGIDLLLESFARFAPRCAEARLTIVGGAVPDVERYRAWVRERGLEDRIRLTGPRPVAELGQILAAADVLVSPRLQGRNTPMKIYAYMQAGKPIVATGIPTHTQVLDASTALLCPPQPESFAEGLHQVAADAGLRQRLGEAARAACEAHYSMAAYERAVDTLCARLAEPVARARD